MDVVGTQLDTDPDIEPDTELKIEQQVTLLMRRVQHMHVLSTAGDVEVERSGYGILSRIADTGPQRLSALAQTFGLDPSTITRQVQALEQDGLLRRSRDPEDRRASLLALTEAGGAVLTTTRANRLERLREALAHWSHEEWEQFGRLLEDFNASIGAVLEARSDGDARGLSAPAAPAR